MNHRVHEVPEIQAPIHCLLPEVLAWLGAQGVPAEVAAPSFSPVLSEQSFDPGDRELRELWAEGVPVSWLGGPAIGLGAWPRAQDGRPLAHVAAISLADAQGVVDAPGRASWNSTTGPWKPSAAMALLPDHGVLEVFHALTHAGDEPADREAGAWVVRWVPEVSGLDLCEGGDPPTPACQQVLAMPGFTLRSPDDVMACFPEVDPGRYLDCHEQWQHGWMVQRFLRDEPHPFGVSHLAGHPAHDRITAIQVLEQALPLSDGDEHVLVLDLESWTSLSGWFGDAGSLEVWMRASDLAGRRFDQAWCLVRTD